MRLFTYNFKKWLHVINRILITYNNLCKCNKYTLYNINLYTLYIYIYLNLYRLYLYILRKGKKLIQEFIPSGFVVTYTFYCYILGMKKPNFRVYTSGILVIWFLYKLTLFRTESEYPYHVRGGAPEAPPPCISGTIHQKKTS